MLLTFNLHAALSYHAAYGQFGSHVQQATLTNYTKRVPSSIAQPSAKLISNQSAVSICVYDFEKNHHHLFHSRLFVSHTQDQTTHHHLADETNFELILQLYSTDMRGRQWQYTRQSIICLFLMKTSFYFDDDNHRGIICFAPVSLVVV